MNLTKTFGGIASLFLLAAFQKPTDQETQTKLTVGPLNPNHFEDQNHERKLSNLEKAPLLNASLGVWFLPLQVQNILAKNYGLTAEAAASACQNFLKSFRKCPENPQYSLHDWRHLLWKKALGDSHSEISGDVYIQWLNFRYKYIAPSQDIISLLESLNKIYYLAVITNGPSASQWEKIKRLHLSQYFHIILVSGDLQWEKPDKYIFLEACTRLGVLPEECIMVGDKPEVDILGGIEAGLGGTVWVPLLKNGTNGAEIVADCVIDDVTRLKCLLSTKTTSKDLSSTINRYLGIDEPEMEDGNSNGSDGS